MPGYPAFIFGRLDFQANLTRLPRIVQDYSLGWLEFSTLKSRTTVYQHISTVGVFIYVCARCPTREASEASLMELVLSPPTWVWGTELDSEHPYLLGHVENNLIYFLKIHSYFCVRGCPCISFYTSGT